MLIQGFQNFSTLDFPDELACIVFTGGCNFRCHYCHNPEMISPAPETQWFDPQAILDFLKTRQGKLDGVVITGGEPTLHADLPDFIKKIRKLGFKVKLDTNGTNPKLLAELYAEKLLDYVAMDLKHPLARYAEITGFADSAPIAQSVASIMRSGVPYEFRSTILPRTHTAREIRAMGKAIKGAEKWYLQNFRPGKTLDPAFADERSFTAPELLALREVGAKFVKHCAIRDWRD